ncbi:MAG: ATP-binding cassette domain-containing protein [Candidatus Kapabacteria bacterium]|nr:ATP-binding cassette domain-containing protein [Candidatus Kapabacteria bacterium]
MKILKIENIEKSFGDFKAVNRVSFSVEKGSVFGILGPNGAGKTTTIRMITNILMPDKGTINLFDAPVGPASQNRIGYLPEERGLYKKLKVIDQLSYFGELKGLKHGDALKKARYWLGKLDAADWENKKIMELSKGMQQKVQFIATILHSPDFLILDEPFSGFDPLNAEILKKIILDFKNEGKTIMLSTHVMEQVEQMCDNICLINKGEALLSGNVREIKSRYSRDTILMEYDGDDSFFDGFSNITFHNRTKNRAEFKVDTESHSPYHILQAAIDKCQVFKFELMEPSLNQIFIDVVTNWERKNG